MLLKTWAALAVALTLPFLHGCGNDDAQRGRSAHRQRDHRIQLARPLHAGQRRQRRPGRQRHRRRHAPARYTGVDKGSYTFDIKSGTGAGNATSATGTVSKTGPLLARHLPHRRQAQAQFLTDEETNPASGNAKLRVFNAASGEAPSVDVYLSTNACNALTVTDTRVRRGAVTGLQTDATARSRPARPAPTGTSASSPPATRSTLLLDIPTLTLKNQEIATLILTHTAGGVLLNGSVLDQQGALTPYTSAISRVRVAADAATSGRCRSRSTTSTLTSQAASPSINDYVTVASGTLTGTVTIDGVTTSNVSRCQRGGRHRLHAARRPARRGRPSSR